MGYITSSLARQSAILSRNSAEAQIIRANQAQQNLAANGGDIKSVSRKETQLELQKIQAETKAKAARAQEKKSKKNKLDVIA